MILRKLGKILAISAAALLLVVLVAMLALKLALDRVHAYQAEIKAWVHARTGFYIRFAHVAPSLRWYGPQLSFRQLELRSKDDRRVIAKAARGSIGSDVWRLLSSGRLFAARIELDSPDILVERTGATRFALASEIPLQGAGAADAGFNLDDLPPGILVLRHGRMMVTNWSRGLPRLVLSDVDLDVRRDAGAIHLSFGARLPRVLGGALQFGATLRRLGDLQNIAWKADLATRDVSFPGWRRLLPDYLDHLRSGSGTFDLHAAGTGRDLARATFNFSAKNVVARSSDGSLARFDRIGGNLALTHEGDRWTLLGRDVRAARAGRSDPASQFDATWRSGGGGMLDLRAHASYLRADNLLPLAGLLTQKKVRDRLLAIAPTGEWTDATLALARRDAAAPWRFKLSAKFHDAGIAAVGHTPGFRGLSGSVDGDQDAGHVRLQTRAATIDWPAQWLGPVPVDRLAGTIYWRRDGAGLLIATPDIEAANRDATVSALASLQLPADGGSPVLTLSGHVKNGNVAATRAYLPRGRLHPKTLAWLDRAFVAGHLADADVVFRGPLRNFPFRDGTGVFLARLHLDGMVLHYGTGWPLIEGGVADAEFRNQGLAVKIESATTDGLTLKGGEAEFADFKSAELTVHVTRSGDAAPALKFLRDSPLNRMAHGAFTAFVGKGPTRLDVRLDFPFKDFAHRRVSVKAWLHGVSLSRAGLPFAATGLTGQFALEGAEVAQADVTGRFLGGPLRILARPPAKGPVKRTYLDFYGTATGAAIAGAFGLTDSAAIDGHADWRGALTLAPGPQPRRVLRIASNLRGIALAAPPPFAKPADRALPSWIELRWPAAAGPVLNFGLGPVVRGSFALRPENAGGGIARAAIAFGDATPTFSDTQLLDVRGRIARLGLAGWRALLPRSGGGASLSTYLKTAKLQVDEADYGGFAVRNLNLGFVAGNDRWQLTIQGPSTEGVLDVPAGGGSSAPWHIDFTRLTVDNAASGSNAPTAGAVGDGGDAPTPTSLPAVDFHAAQLDWVGRNFGDVSATLTRLADGVALTHLTVAEKSLRGEAHGTWRGSGAGTGELAGSLQSSDVEKTLSELGYAPVLAAKKGRLDFDLHWSGAPSSDTLRDATGRVQVALQNGQVFGIKPGAGRVLGLASVAALPRRLALDFSDLTDKGLAFDTVTGTFNLRGGNAYTNNVLLKGPAAEIGLIGRIGLKNKDYDQTAVVTGSFGNSLPLAGALAGGPVVGAAVLLFTQVFKQPLRGLARGYYHITGSWNNPTVERIKNAAGASAIAEGKN
ncbi:MAG: TIGR02099 family protein [Gammaproteobacteria bacterium]|nr:TIGR02099 family protein [Gammaproteobacteria bacterium]